MENESGNQREVNFDTEITRITNEVLSDGAVERIMREKITKGFEDAIESSFSYGELRRAIESRVKDVLVPCIERYDMGKYIVKLDEILSQIVSQSALVDNKRILENFRTLMVEPKEKTISFNLLFGVYQKFVAANVDTSGLEVDCDDESSYQYVKASAEIVKSDEPFSFVSSFDYATLYFQTDEDEELSFSVRLSRWKDDSRQGFDISYDAVPIVTSLARINGFEAYLITLSQAGVKLTFESNRLEESVLPDAVPEPIFA